MPRIRTNDTTNTDGVRYLVRLRPELREAIERLAAQRVVSMNKLINDAIADALETSGELQVQVQK
jgi:predicted HicB family RNase H-like nuclease